jgi:carotenoid 1,2-hydratase
MTERGRRDLHWEPHILGIGPSALTWDGNSLKIDIDEIAVPFPRRLRGTVIIEPTGINPDEFLLEEKGHHIWRPIAPSSRVQVAFDKPGISWKGHGYLDMNSGDEPLAKGFSSWTWSRAQLDQGAAILYDAERRRENPLSLALRFDNSGKYEKFEPPQRTPLPRTLWQVKRETRADNGDARVIRTLEDTPFYSRTQISSQLFGENAPSVHESLSMDRFQNPIVRMMLPFRMPRR